MGQILLIRLINRSYKSDLTNQIRLEIHAIKFLSILIPSKFISLTRISLIIKVNSLKGTQLLDQFH